METQESLVFTGHVCEIEGLTDLNNLSKVTTNDRPQILTQLWSLTSDI